MVLVITERIKEVYMTVGRFRGASKRERKKKYGGLTTSVIFFMCFPLNVLFVILGSYKEDNADG